MNLEQLRAAMREALERRDAAQGTLDQIVSAAEARGDQTLTAEETATITEMREAVSAVDAELDDLEARVAAAEASERSRARAEELRQRIGVSIVGVAEGAEDRSAADELTAFVNGETRSYVARPEVRDMITTGIGAQTHTVPTNVYQTIITGITEQSQIVSLASPLNTSDARPMDFPTAQPLTVETLTEAEAIPEIEPSGGFVTNTPVKYGRLIQISFELGRDAVVDWVRWVADEAGTAVGAKYGAAATAVAVAGATAGAAPGAISADQLIDHYYSVAQAYRNNGVWVCNSATAAQIRKLKSTDGVSLWTAPLSAGEPGTLLGRPIYTDDTMAGTGTVLFGDFKRGMISRIAGGIRFERSDEYAFNRDVSTYRVILFAAASIVNGAAIKKITAA